MGWQRIVRCSCEGEAGCLVVCPRCALRMGEGGCKQPVLRAVPFILQAACSNPPF